MIPWVQGFPFPSLTPPCPELLPNSFRSNNKTFHEVWNLLGGSPHFPNTTPVFHCLECNKDSVFVGLNEYI